MEKRRRPNFLGILLLVGGLLSVFIFGLQTYNLVYDCRYLPGLMPLQGCEYYLHLSYYFGSSSTPLWLGVSLAVAGVCLILLRRSSGDSQLATSEAVPAAVAAGCCP
jgi:hypothetical protein